MIKYIQSSRLVHTISMLCIVLAVLSASFIPEHGHVVAGILMVYPLVVFTYNFVNMFIKK